MERFYTLLLNHEYIVLFLSVFAEQIGVPFPSLAVLLGAGALIAAGRIHPAGAIGISVAACAIADYVWFLLGRSRGNAALQLACKLALNPRVCAARAKRTASRYGARVLLGSKFVPGLSLIMPAIAGMLHVRLQRFLLFDLLSASIWAGLYLGVGAMFHKEVVAIAITASQSSSVVFAACATLLVLAILWRAGCKARLRSSNKSGTVVGAASSQSSNGGQRVPRP